VFSQIPKILTECPWLYQGFLQSDVEGSRCWLAPAAGFVTVGCDVLNRSEFREGRKSEGPANRSPLLDEPTGTPEIQL